MPSIPRSSPRPQMSVRNRSKARRIPGGRTRAAVMNTRESVSTASRAGRARPPVSRSKRAVAAGSSTLPVAGSGSMFHTRRIRSAQSSSPREVSARSSRCGARHASRTVAASGQPTRTTSDPSSASAASRRDILLMVAVRPAQERRGLVMSLGHPFHDVLRVGGVFELHQDRRVVHPQPLDSLEAGGPAPGAS